MTAKPKCLHIPTLYEEGDAVFSWRQMEDAEEYRLEASFDETFDEAAKGRSWQDLAGSQFSWGEFQDQELTWQEFHQIPNTGLTWRNVHFHEPTWQDIEDSDWEWRLLRTTPLDFRVYQGPGTPVPGPEQGLSWQDIHGDIDSWQELEDHDMSWREFTFLPSRGYTWQDINCAYQTWEEIRDHDTTWREFAHLPPKGLSWDDINARHLSWQEVHDKDASWQDFHQAPIEDMEHRAFGMQMPLYKKRAAFRIMSLSPGGESEYLESMLLPLLPRSLKKYKPPCIHIPTLHEGEPAEIVWGDLYGAFGFVVERKTVQDFQQVYDGPGNAVEYPANGKPCPELQRVYDVDTHLSCVDMVPIGAKQAIYRVKAYNTTDESQYITAEEQTVIPIFVRDSIARFSVTAGQTYELQISAVGVRRLPEVPLTLTYSNHLQLQSFASQSEYGEYSNGHISNANPQVVSHQAGTIRFICNLVLPAGTQWSGTITRPRFLASTNGTAQIQLT